MKKQQLKALLLTVIFAITYSFFVTKIKFSVEGYSDIVVGTTFFFTLFIGYFITRQNDRYSSISDQLTSNDGWFSYLYRVTGLVPRIQDEVREITREHYAKIVESGDLAYHVKNPSNTLTRITKALGSVTEKELDNPAAEAAWSFLFEVVGNLQLTRKKILNLYGEKLVPFQMAIVYILGILLVVSFNFVPSSYWVVDVIKIFFGTSVFIAVVLLRLLDNLVLFGDTIGMRSVQDVVDILDEKDEEDLG